MTAAVIPEVAMPDDTMAVVPYAPPQLPFALEPTTHEDANVPFQAGGERGVAYYRDFHHFHRDMRGGDVAFALDCLKLHAESPAESLAAYGIIGALTQFVSFAPHTAKPEAWILPQATTSIGRHDWMIWVRHDDGDILPFALEVDGRDYHSDPQRFAADRKRDRDLLAMGIIPIRFAASELHQDLGCMEICARIFGRGMR